MGFDCGAGRALGSYQTLTVRGYHQRRRRGLSIILRGGRGFCIAAACSRWRFGGGARRRRDKPRAAEAPRLDPFAPLGDTDAGGCLRIRDWA